MTEAAGNARSEYSGNGATTTFAIGFGYDATSDVKVIFTDTDGTDTTWSLGTQYTISSTNVVVSTSPTDYTPASGTKLTIISNASIAQSTNLNNTAYDGENIEGMGDSILIRLKQVKELADRAPKLKESTRTTTPTFPEPSAGLLIGWNGAGDDLENKTSTDTTETLPATADSYLKRNSAGTAFETKTAPEVLADIGVYITRSEATSLSFAPSMKGLSTAGYTSAGDGGGAAYNRVDAEPSHEGKFRSTDRYLSDGTTDATNGGWWELVLDSGEFKVESAGVFTSNAAAANVTAWDNVSSIVEGLGVAHVRFGEGTYLFSAAVEIEFTTASTFVRVSGAGIDATILQFSGAGGGLSIKTKPTAGPLNISKAHVHDFAIYADAASIAYGLRIDGQLASGDDGAGGSFVERITIRNTSTTNYFDYGIECIGQSRSLIRSCEYAGGYSALAPATMYGTAFHFNRPGNHKLESCNVQIANTGLLVDGDTEGVLCSNNTFVGVVKGVDWTPTSPSVTSETYFEWSSGHINAYDRCFDLSNITQVRISGGLFYWFSQGTPANTFYAIAIDGGYNHRITGTEIWVQAVSSPPVAQHGINIKDANQVVVSDNLITTGETGFKTTGFGITVQGEGPGTTDACRNISIKDNIIKGYDEGVRFGTTDGVVRNGAISGNQIDFCNYALKVQATASLRPGVIDIEGNQMTRIATTPMTLDSVQLCAVNDNSVYEDGVTISANNLVILETHASGGDYNFTGNRWVSARGVNFSAVSASTVKGSDNAGLVLSKRSSASISASTTVDVTHGFSIPLVAQDINVVQFSGTDPGHIRVTIVSATVFRITVGTSGTYTMLWNANKES